MAWGQRERLRARARVALAALTLLSVVAVTACGSDRKEQSEAARRSADPATAQCRAKWADLASQLEDNEKRTQPSALATRWTSVVATVDYYASSAKSTDCGSHLDAQEKAVAALRSFSESLRDWDTEYQLFLVQTRAEGYASRPRPTPSDEADPKKQNKKKATKKHRSSRETVPPKPKAVTAALKVLDTSAPKATKDQAPAWQQAAVIDLDDKEAVKKARKDLAFLSRHSKAYQECRQALDVIHAALKAAP